MKTISRTVAFIELTGRPSGEGDAPTVIFSGRIMQRQPFAVTQARRRRLELNVADLENDEPVRLLTHNRRLDEIGFADEGSDEAIGRRVVQRRGRTDLRDPALVHHRHPV